MTTHTDFSVASILGAAGNRSSSPTVAEAPKTRQRRSRTMFSEEALQILEAEFERNQYPDINSRERLSEQIGVSEARVQVWFQNRRSRQKRSKLTSRKPKVTPSASSSPTVPKPVPSRLLPVAPPVSSTTSITAAYTQPFFYGYNPFYVNAGMYPMMPFYGFAASPFQTPIPSSPSLSPNSPSVSKLFDFPAPISPIPNTPVSNASFNFYGSDVTTGDSYSENSPPLRLRLPTRIVAPECSLRELSASEGRTADHRNKNSLLASPGFPDSLVTDEDSNESSDVNTRASDSGISNEGETF